jgi:hypothetical protein
MCIGRCMYNMKKLLHIVYDLHWNERGVKVWTRTAVCNGFFIVVQQLTVYSSLWLFLQIHFSEFLYLSFVNFRFDGRVVARLPFVPISWIQGLSHRNLPGDDYTECSFIFLYILCTMSIRQVSQIDAWPPPWSEFLTTGPEVLGFIPNANGFSEKLWVWNGVHSASWR